MGTRRGRYIKRNFFGNLFRLFFLFFSLVAVFVSSASVRSLSGECVCVVILTFHLVFHRFSASRMQWSGNTCKRTRRTHTLTIETLETDEIVFNTLPIGKYSHEHRRMTGCQHELRCDWKCHFEEFARAAALAIYRKIHELGINKNPLCERI